MNSFALYRLPYDTRCTLVEQASDSPQELGSCTALSKLSGFVLAPFSVSELCPLLLIRPDRVSVMGQDELLFWPKRAAFWAETPSVLGQNASCFGPKRSDYSIDFANFHAQLAGRKLDKIVLSRCSLECKNHDIAPLKLFAEACKRYPRLFVALVFTPQSGLWLAATPEVLLENDGRQWHTVALAGTMKLSDEQLADDVPQVDWSVKNIQEQRMVATYVMECLEHFSADIVEQGPRTVRAANLVHLRSDFTFTLSNSARVGELLHALHPTPAVCGLPKRSAFEFILHNEHTPRRYYSGFMGPLGLQWPGVEEPPQTHLFVSLRCMLIEGRRYSLYAGGGLLRESTEEQEWQETEAKLETMRSLLASGA